MLLSRNFSLNEFIKSDTAKTLDIANYPSDAEIDNLKLLCINVLQPIRERFNKPITISSGYRCKALNKAVGGSKTSSHMYGYAADLIVHDFEEVFKWIVDNIEYTQAIIEENSKGNKWIHISYIKNNLKQNTLRYKNGNYSVYK